MPPIQIIERVLIGHVGDEIGVDAPTNALGKEILKRLGEAGYAIFQP
jgi:hypothetical protein